MEALNLGRVGHYHVPSGVEAGSCQMALVAHVETEATGQQLVNLMVAQQDGDTFTRQDVPAMLPPSPERASFHLNRDCPHRR